MTGLRRYVPLLAVGALLAAAAVAAALSTPQITQVPVPHDMATGATGPAVDTARAARPSGGPGGVQQTWQLPGWLSTVLTALCVVVVAVVVGLVLWLLLRDRLGTRTSRLPVEPEPANQLAPQHGEVLAAVEAGLSDLDDADADPRRAVIACWVRLEQAAAAAGTPRAPGDSPTDLVLRLLGAHQVSASVLYPLAEVYRLARYATHAVDVGMRDQARAALGQLRAELRGKPAPVPGEPVPVPGEPP